MNKYDIGLLVFIFFFVIGFYLFSNKNKDPLMALVKYNGEVIKEIDLSLHETRVYEVMGDNGKVVIEAEFGRVRIIEETSPLNICSKMGWRSDVLVCLPNRIVVEMYEDDGLDAVIR